ncbi:glycosyltransferase family 4 protein, partial [Candidatus Micrarchaeota archaeon]|nr:glycosyltransferase family 4 protein [Candidatus Micrarchaeota archaeon]
MERNVVRKIRLKRLSEMRVLMLNPFFLPYSGGTEKHVYEVSKRLAKKFDVTVFTAELPNTKHLDEMDGIKIVRTPATILQKLPYPIPPPMPIAPFELRDLRKAARDADIVHIHNRFYYGPAHLLLLKTLRKKMALTLHNARPQGISPATDFLGGLYDETIGQMTMRSCERIAAVSRNTLEITVPPELLERGRVIYNGVDTERFNPRNKGERVREKFGCAGGKMVLCVSRLIEQKGIAYLIRAMAEVKQEIDAKLVVLGRGPLENELRNETKKAGVEKEAIFITERISEEELARLYAACDVFCLPSLWEPLGMVFCEAMSSGKPAVGSRIGGIPEIITPDVGMLCEPKNPKNTAEKLILVLGDEKLRKKMGEAGRKRVLEKFTWDRTAEGYEKL